MSVRVPISYGAATTPRVVVEVVESRMVARTTLAVVRILDGEPQVGMVLQSEGGRRWEVRGFALAPKAATEVGRRGILLAPVLHDRELGIGETLYAAV